MTTKTKPLQFGFQDINNELWEQLLPHVQTRLWNRLRNRLEHKIWEEQSDKLWGSHLAFLGK